MKTNSSPLQDNETAIRDAIFDIILAAYSQQPTDGLQPAFGSEKIFMIRVWPGQQIEGKEYGNAWSPTNSSGNQAATENLSILVDAIPILLGSYSRSGRTVEGTYDYVLDSAMVFLNESYLKNSTTALMKVNADIAMRSDVEVAAKDGTKIRTVTMNNVVSLKQKLEVDYANAVAHLNAVNRLLYEWPNDVVERSLLQTRVLKLKNIAKSAWNKMRSVEPLTSSVTSDKHILEASFGSVANAFVEAKAIFLRSRLASNKNPGIQYHPSYLSPEDWVSEEASKDWPEINIPIHLTGSSISLTLRFSRVDITRPWFLLSLFDLNGWKTDLGAGSLSTGTIENNQGLFPLLPTSVIVTRNIEAKISDGTVVFQSKGLQILAWVCIVMPYSPPASTPPVPVPILTTIKVTPATALVDIGNIQIFAASALDQNDKPIAASILWTSSNTPVGTIDSNGVFKAVAEGMTTIKAASGNISGTATATVTPAIIPIIYFADAYPGASGSVYKLDNGYTSTFYTRATGGISSLAFSCGGILYYCDANAFNLYELVNGQETLVYQHNTYLRCVKFDSKGNIYFSDASGAGSDGHIYRLDNAAAVLYYTVKLTDVGFWAGDFSFDENNNLYLSNGNEQGASIYCVENGVPKQIFSGNGDSITGFSFDTAGKLYYTTWSGGEIYQVDLSTGNKKLIYSNPGVSWLSDVFIK